jgi:prephenate dehydratase
VFSTEPTNETLVDLLKAFAEAQVSLARISALPPSHGSEPRRFLVEIQTDDMKSEVESILEKLKPRAEMLECLGCYREVVFE